MAEAKPILWIGSSLGDLREFPAEVKREVGFALREAQNGGKSPASKPLKGFNGASVLEIVEDFDTDTYRAIYTVRFEEAVYVLHCFQKKSTSGIKTPQHVIDLIRKRYKVAEQEHRKWQESNPKPPRPKKK